MCRHNPVLANNLELLLYNSCWASVETLHGIPKPDRDGKEKVRGE